MLTPFATQIALFVLATGCVGALALALFYPLLVRDGQSHMRLKAVVEGLKAPSGPGKSGDSRRKRSLEDVLREIEEKQRARQRAKPTLVARIRQAGLGWSKSTYYAVCAGAGIASFFAAYTGLGPYPLTALGFGIAGGLLLPHFYVNRRRAKRFAQFTSEFANAMDIIVRGLKAGLPLADCMKIIAAEAQEPVKGEFMAIIQDQAMGMPADEAVQRMPQRMPVTEASFFAIVIAIQSRTGGSLAEALGNLSKVLRERKKMQAKIKAMSQEAKASAGIIGVLPVFVTGAIYLTTPDYIALLFTTSAGNTILAVAGFWMLIGILVMRKMINFDF
ncbi:MAG TPA: type II secretion system F family protein [Aestuariivirgaceae bacterium]|nr:type II secretion system F family protein [Aestuariivirgaceae bacterium]